MITFVLPSLAHIRKCSDTHCALMILVIIHWLDSWLLTPQYVVSELALPIPPLIRRGRSGFFPPYSGNTCSVKSDVLGTPLGVQWLRIHLSMQGTQIQPLV